MPLLAGLIGDPVSHSRSPALHNVAFAQLGIDAHYELWQTSAAELPARIAGLRQPGVLGANVTLPHKLAVMPLLDQVDTLAALIGAVNTIVRQPDGSLIGSNTDAPALLAALQEDAGYHPAGQSAVVLGASGAARAAAAVLIQAGVTELTIVNRTLERAESLLADMALNLDTLLEPPANPPYPDTHEPRLYALTPDDPALSSALATTSLIVNATSIGWHGDETPLAAEYIPAGVLVYDMVYRPTRLLREAAARGARAIDGSGMLVRQAALAFARWTRQQPPTAMMRAAFDA